MTEKDDQKTSGNKEVASGSSKAAKKTSKKASKKVSKRRDGSSATTSNSAASHVDSRKSDTVEAVATATDGSGEGNAGAPVSSAQGSSSAKSLAITAVLLSVLALAGAGYAWYQTAVNARLAGGEQSSRISALENRLEQNSSDQSGVAEQLSELRQLVGSTESGLSAQFSELRSGASAQQQKLDSEIADVREDFRDFRSSVGDIRQELGSSIDQWGRREAEHLLVIANQRLKLARDPEGALTALQLADERLQALDDPSLLDVRQTLGSEIAQLSGVSAPDIVSATTTITLLSKNLENLPLKGETRVPRGPEEPSGENDAGQSADQSAGQEIANIGRNFLADLGNLIQVEKDGEPVAPTITPEMGALTVKLGQLMLEGAQVALIRSQPEVFNNRLEAAATWVGQNFQGESEITANWLGQLDALKEFSPEAAYPDISGSLNAIRSATATEG